MVIAKNKTIAGDSASVFLQLIIQFQYILKVFSKLHTSGFRTQLTGLFVSVGQYPLVTNTI